MNLDSRRLMLAVTTMSSVAFAVRIIVAFTLPNISHPDEVFQYLEQAHRLVYGFGIIPWEFREGVRSWLFPGLLADAMRLGSILFPGPFGYIVGVRVTLALLSLSPVIVGTLWGHRVGGIKSGIVTGFLCAIWFELIFFATKTLSEVLASDFLIVGLFLCYPDQEKLRTLRLLLSGAAIGLAVSLRMHLAPACVVIFAYVCRTDWRDKWTRMLGGVLLPVFAIGLLDWATWGYPFQSIWKYFYMDTVQGVAAQFSGSQPWYYYCGIYVLIWSGAIVPLLWCIVLGARRLPLLFIVAATIVLSHMFIAQKQLRFIYPAIPIVVILAGIGSVELVSSWWERTRPAGLTPIVFLMVGWLWTSLALAVGDHFRPFWVKERGVILASKELNKKSDLCGIGFYGIRWAETGGYSFLHRDVPLYEVRSENDVERLKPSLNYLVANANSPPSDPSFESLQCWPREGICVYRRSGVCSEANLSERMLFENPNIRFQIK